MPKISDLTAASTLTGAELIPLVQAGTTKRSTVAAMAGSGYYNVKSYGAVANGTTNDAPAIQAAIDAASAAGGGVVYVPPGTYRIQPSGIFTNAACLYIQNDNITLLGAGRNVSKLDYATFSGLDPASNWDTLAGAVQRGHGIRIVAKPASGTRLNVTISGLELDGNAGNTSNRSFPANTSTGDGWDLTMKGIIIDPNERHDNILIEDCYIHAWRGEVVYYGGQFLAKFIVRDCKLGDSNADGISAVGTDQVVERNEIYSNYNAAIENGYFDGYSVYRFNYIHDNFFGGIQVFPAVQTVLTGGCAIHDNYHVNNGSNYHRGAINMRVYNNYFRDYTGYAIYFVSPGAGGDSLQTIRMDNVECYGNRLINNSLDVGGFIYLGGDGSTLPRRVQIHDNTVLLSAAANAAGKNITSVVDLADINPGSGTVLRNNNAYNTNNPNGVSGMDNTTAEPRGPSLLTNTSSNLVAAVYDRTNWVKKVFISWNVVTAATNLTLQIKYYDQSAVEQTITLLSAASQAVGFYSQFFQLARGGFGNVGQLQVWATAGTANQLSIAVSIRD